MKKRRIICVLFALVFVLCSAATSFGKVSDASIGAKRHSNTSATGRASATFTSKAKKCTVKMVLQKKVKGKWKTAKDHKVWSVATSRSNVGAIGIKYKFTLKKGKKYRLLNTFTDTNSKGTTYSKTYACSTF